MKNHPDIQSAYNRWSHTYDVQENATRDLDALVLKRIVPELAGQTVVEVGCGTGKNTNWLAPRCKRLIGLDFSSGMLAVAGPKVQGTNVHFLRCDIRRPWPLADAGAGIVLFNLVLEHIEFLEPVFRSASRVMLAGARLIISEFHPQRILNGEGARIDASADGVPEFVGSFAHSIEDYQGVAKAVGLHLQSWGEWTEDALHPDLSHGGEPDPLILSLSFEKNGLSTVEPKS